MSSYTVVQTMLTHTVLILFFYHFTLCNYVHRNHYSYMFPSKPLRDPLGNTIQIPAGVLDHCSRDIADISTVITAPSFIIREREEKIYFFKLITWKINMLVEACLQENDFVVQSCQENPSTEYISSLLKKGNLISFQ
jgi:hypothetical protein